MSTIIFSDDMTQPYSEFITDALHKFAEYKVKKIAIVGFLDNDQTYCGYYKMNTYDKVMASEHIKSDATMEIITANIDTIREALKNLEGQDYD
ncbi:hypothetical protein [Fumia xinanensis]|uniref:Uncharacterized protein n=1 Tax=Fumia xinanensis TaxID=2763659 RepID=A0A926I5H9_9FIRM|nr:hypothetical protein [Fumia xinanensis]MBC8558885.1 hypothetical protein [Fumia xinanensis]